jgi:hypothetical protein
MEKRIMPTKTGRPTAQETLNELLEEREQIVEKIDELLNPALSREDIVVGLQELEELLSNDDEDEDEESDEEDEE